MADKEIKTKTEVEEDKKVVETEKVEDKKATESKKAESATDTENAQTTKKSEDDQKDKKEEKKPEVKLEKKFEATAHGSALHFSLKHSKYICAMISGKSIDKAMEELEQVTKLKRVVPFKGEIPHKPGKGMMSGRYPIKASAGFITLLKGLKGNAIQNQMDLDKTKITIASPSWARRPMRKGNKQGKRVNIILKAIESGSESNGKKIIGKIKSDSTKTEAKK